MCITSCWNLRSSFAAMLSSFHFLSKTLMIGTSPAFIMTWGEKIIRKIINNDLQIRCGKYHFVCFQPPKWSPSHVVLQQTLAVSRSYAVSRETVTRRCRWRTRTAARMRRRIAVTRRSAVRTRNVLNNRKNNEVGEDTEIVVQHILHIYFVLGSQL